MSLKDEIRNELRSDYILGAYHREGNTAYFDDLRGAAGERIEDFDGNPISQTVACDRLDLVEGEFYEFDWDVVGDSVSDYKYICTGNIHPVDKPRMLQVRLNEKRGQHGTNRKDANQNQDMINREVTGAPHTYIYELLQNSNDYPCRKANKEAIPVRVNFILTEHYLFFIHSGAPFNLRNIAAICTVNEGEKRDNTETIGYKGMGFKSVFVNNDYVYLKSGGWSLRFDEKEINRPGAYKRNWQYMPIPTSESELDDEIKGVLSSLEGGMNVFFALRHVRDAKENIPNLKKVFCDDKRILIFIPNVDEVKVSIGGEEPIYVSKDREHWDIETVSLPVDEGYKKVLEEERKKTGNKIPEKFLKIKNISISFAVKHNGNKIEALEAPRVYNYLPTEQTLYLPFLLNADFVPDAQRAKLPELEWNFKVLEDAGKLYAHWWTESLMSVDKGYDLYSVFDVLPEKRNADEFRNRFMKGFMTELVKIPCIPVLKDGKTTLKPLKEIIYDNMGFIATENPVMSDEDFYKLTGFSAYNEYLPHPVIRLHPKLKELLSHFSNIGIIGRSLKIEDIIQITHSKNFDSWMQNETNAISFYRYLFESGKMSRLLVSNNRIFLTEDMKVATPNSIYFNIDSYLKELYMFEDLLPRLNTRVRDELLSAFRSIDGQFKHTAPVSIALEFAGGFDRMGYAERIKSKEDSINFLSFLASAKEGTSTYTGRIPQTMPLFLRSGEVYAGCSNLYQADFLGEDLADQFWVKDEWIKFISDDYALHSDDLKRLLERCGVTKVAPQIIWDKFVSNNERIPYILSSIREKRANIAFYRFLLKIDKEVKFTTDKSLKTQYSIWAEDGKTESLVPLSTVLYFPNSTQRVELLNMEWLPAESCWSIAEEYFSSDTDNIRQFFKSQGIADEFTTNHWIRRCMNKEHVWTEMIKRVTDTETSISLLEFLFANSAPVKEFGLKKLKDVPLSLDGEKELIPLTEIPANETVYQVSSDIRSLKKEMWFPYGELTMTAEEYSDLFDGADRRAFFKEVGIDVFDKDNYIEDVILANLENFTEPREDVDPLEANISFHRFFANPSLKISDEDWEELKKTPVYTLIPSEDGFLTGEKQPESTGHFLPSDKIGALTSLDIIPSEILRSIRPEYFAENRDRMEVYFKDKLGNRKLEDNEIVQHLVAHKDEISPYLSNNLDRNIRFWRWAAQTSTNFEQRKAFREFPMLDTNGNLLMPPDLYVSCEYSKDKEAEEVIRRFVPDAHFVYSGYLTEEDDLNWLQLFKSLKMGITASYVLLQQVLAKLNEYKTPEDDVVIAFAGIYDELKQELDSKTEAIEGKLKSLHVLCNDGQYRRITDVIISGTYTDVESGKYQSIVLPNQLSEEYLAQTEENPTLRNNIIKLFKLISKIDGIESISKAQDLAAKKVKYFIQNQARYLNSPAHFSIIGELAEDYTSKVVWVQESLKGKALKLCTNDERTFETDKARVYLGSSYAPVCDFQAHGAPGLAYVSDEYRKHAVLSSIKPFLISLNIRWGFHGESEMKLVESPEFSQYFWGTFLPIQLESKDYHTVDHFKRLLKTETLEKYHCIPTGVGMKCPSEVYNPNSPQLVRMLKAMGKADEFLPVVPIPVEFTGGFASELTPTDCLDYLSLNENTRQYDRDDVYVWLSKVAHNEGLLRSNFKNIVSRFVKTVKWKTGDKKTWDILGNLYIIDGSIESKLIRDHFSGSPYVAAAMPESNTVLKDLCTVFAISPITKEDFDIKPIGDSVEDTEEVARIKKRILYLSYKENPTGDWKKKYEDRLKILDGARILCCDKIIYFCVNDDKLSTSIYFYDEKEIGFSYKKGCKAHQFNKIIEWVKSTFNIYDYDLTVLESLFMEDFVDYINTHEGGQLPPDVMEILAEIAPSDWKALTPEVIEEAPTDEQPYVSTKDVPVWNPDTPSEPSSDNQTAPQKETEREQIKPESEREPAAVATDGQGVKKSPDSPNGNISDKAGNKSHATNDHGHQNPASKVPEEKPNVKEEPTATEEPSFEARSKKRWDERRDAKVTPPTSMQPTHADEESVLDIEDPVDSKPNYGDVSAKGSDASSKIKRHETKSPQTSAEQPRDYRSGVDSAKQKAKEEEEKCDRRNTIRDKEPYTLEWFNYLIDMQQESLQTTGTSQRSIDFYDWQLMDSVNNVYRLVSPSTFIPSNLAEASNVSIKIISNGKMQNLVAEILESDETGIDMKCSQYFGNASPTRWLRIEYQNTGGFSEALANRFSHLNHKYPLQTRLDKKLPDSIRFIYGPPGTGKTTELVRRISEEIRNNAKINILVVTPTNRAADEIAERLAVDTFAGEYLSRYGITESRELIAKHPEVLKNRHSMNLRERNKNVMVTTIARYPYDSVQGEPIFEINWDLIIVDEASMIDLVPITLLLVNQKAPRFLIAGDPMQIRPVKPSFDFPDDYVFNIYDMVDINSFKEAKDGKSRFPVDVLDVQHRSVPAIGSIVSEFAYDGVLKNDPAKGAPKRLNIPGVDIQPINIVGYEVMSMSHLYDFHMVDNSYVHVYSAIFAYEFAAYISRLVKKSNPAEPYSIGIVSPYKKQASAIQELLANRPINNDKCQISCGTVHKFQGSQCDIMIVVMNYPNTTSGAKANINNLNIMNVAMSRAKDYVFFLMPERNVNEKAVYPMNDAIINLLPDNVKNIHAHYLEKVIFGDEVYIAKNASLRSHLPVNVSTPTDKRYEVRISDTALDILIND